MHAACWRKHYDDVLGHERLRNRLRHPQSFDVNKNEFLCPLCRCLSNTVIPIIPQFHVLQPVPEKDAASAAAKPAELSLSDWIQALLIAASYKRELKEVVRESAEAAAEEGAGAKEGGGGASPSSTAGEVGSSPTAPKGGKMRLYTCPLDQVDLLLLDTCWFCNRNSISLSSD